MQKSSPLSRPGCWGASGARDAAGAADPHPGRRDRQANAGGDLRGDARFISAGDTSCPLSHRVFPFFSFPLSTSLLALLSIALCKMSRML